MVITLVCHALTRQGAGYLTAERYRYGHTERVIKGEAMGKHDQTGHFLHIPKAMKFKQPKPNANTQATEPPQKPAQGTDSQNMYR